MLKARTLVMTISSCSDDHAKSPRRRFNDFSTRKLWKFGAAWLVSFISLTNALADATLRPGDTIELKIGGVPSTDISAVSGRYTIAAKVTSTSHTSVASKLPDPHLERLKP